MRRKKQEMNLRMRTSNSNKKRKHKPRLHQPTIYEDNDACEPPKKRQR